MKQATKQPFETLKAKLEADAVDPNLAFLSVLPDCPHVGKSIKSAFSNWWLKSRGEQINLALLRTLRNCSNRATKDKFKRLIPKNDHVKNKDRQDPPAVLTLSNSKLTDELSNTGYVCHTIIPKLDKFSPDNQVGMHTSPISVAVPCYGWIAFLSYDVKTSTCTLFKARLHSPVDKIIAMRKNLKVKEIHSSDGIIFISAESGSIKAVEFQEGSIFLISKKVKQKKKRDLVDLANKLQVQSTGTVAEITSRIQAYSDSLTISEQRQR